MCAHGSGLVSPLAWTNLFVTVWSSTSTCALSLQIAVLTGLFMSFAFPRGSLQVVVQPPPRFFALMCALRCCFGRSGHCLSECLHCFGLCPRCSLNSMTHIRAHVLLGKCAKDSSLFRSSFHPLGLHVVPLCPAFPLWLSVSGSPLSGEHSPVSVLYCLQLFPMELQLSAVTRPFVFFFLAVSLWLCPSATPVRCSLRALLDVRPCEQVVFGGVSSCFQHCEII